MGGAFDLTGAERGLIMAAEGGRRRGLYARDNTQQAADAVRGDKPRPARHSARAAETAAARDSALPLRARGLDRGAPRPGAPPPRRGRGPAEAHGRGAAGAPPPRKRDHPRARRALRRAARRELWAHQLPLSAHALGQLLGEGGPQLQLPAAALPAGGARLRRRPRALPPAAHGPLRALLGRGGSHAAGLSGPPRRAARAPGSFVI